jgi:hypothetical protein
MNIVTKKKQKINDFGNWYYIKNCTGNDISMIIVKKQTNKQ